MRHLLIFVLIVFGLNIYGSSIGPYEDGATGFGCYSNPKDSTTYVMALDTLNISNYTILSNELNQYVLHRGSHFNNYDNSQNISDSSYYLLNFNELMRISSFYYPALAPQNLLRLLPPILTGVYIEFANDTIVTELGANRFKIEYRRAPDYFLLMLYNGSAFNRTIQEKMSFFVPREQYEEAQRKYSAHPRQFRDSNAFYRFLVPMWKESMAPEDDEIMRYYKELDRERGWL